ncbi:hypothetical protein [Acetobacter sp.]|jgi:hypothetical protein|uniref:hypothetical protein n=1 Tax=Acetobacter sp. TaxID=440 RepID=UPI0025BC015E|nr:hypothetical protein [Acetobacter sp.]MCH4092118.1 hypothetical protein [Acetobacter sp.]MCI1299965.1 hypothetical protein [Acetobacter sp.]MCI1315983.1 hypothetical protein [Acetobacter sp.]
MSQIDREKQAHSRSYNGPNPIRMNDQDWNVMISALSNEQKEELNELRHQARCCARMAVSGAQATAVTLEVAETAMEVLLRTLTEMEISFPFDGFSFSGSYA